jgi:hypothetical protein
MCQLCAVLRMPSMPKFCWSQTLEGIVVPRRNVCRYSRTLETHSWGRAGPEKEEEIRQHTLFRSLLSSLDDLKHLRFSDTSDLRQRYGELGCLFIPLVFY